MTTFMGFKSPKTGAVQLLHDIDLVKADLLNHFMTRKGERVMNAEYGFIGWDLIFELKVPGIREALEEDARRIINTDPRVTEQNIIVTEEENGFTVTINLYFVLLDSVDTLTMFFDANRANAQT